MELKETTKRYTCNNCIKNVNPVKENFDFARHDSPQYVQVIAEYVPLVHKCKTILEVKRLSEISKIPLKKLITVSRVKVKNGKVLENRCRR